MHALDLSVATEFLLTAAVLLELKARRLLPESSDGEDEEELALWEERDLLLARLLECKTFKDASAAMSRLMDTSDLSVARRTGMEERFVGLAPDLLEGVGAEDLHRAIVKLLAAKPVVRVNTDHVAPVRASVADTVTDLVAKLPSVGRTTFQRLTAWHCWSCTSVEPWTWSRRAGSASSISAGLVWTTKTISMVAAVLPVQRLVTGRAGRLCSL
jgi:segregation and condensation protein A